MEKHMPPQGREQSPAKSPGRRAAKFSKPNNLFLLPWEHSLTFLKPGTHSFPNGIENTLPRNLVCICLEAGKMLLII